MPQPLEKLRMEPGNDPQALSVIFLYAEKDYYNARAIFLPQKQICALIKKTTTIV